MVGPPACTVAGDAAAPAPAGYDPAVHDVVVVVVCEDSCAEMRGTIKPWRPVSCAAPVPVALPVLAAGVRTPFTFRVGGHNTWSRPELAPQGRTDLLVVRADRPPATSWPPGWTSSTSTPPSCSTPRRADRVDPPPDRRESHVSVLRTTLPQPSW